MAASDAAQKAIAWRGAQVDRMTAPNIVEIEVDSLAQLRDVLAVNPDIVLLDNFTVDELRQAVEMRNKADSRVELGSIWKCQNRYNRRNCSDRRGPY